MRALLYAVIVAGAVVIQVTIMDGLPLPGGAAPDLVLLAVVALALNGGPVAGAVTGFAAGLVFDLAPPQSHVIGLSALVLCLLGYFCGLASRELERSVFLPLAAMALGAAAGAVLYVAVGKMFGDPRYSWAAVRHILPATVAYDVLASPFVLYVVSRLIRLAGQVPVPGGAPVPALPGRPAGAGLLGTVAPARAAAGRTGAEPRIRRSGRTSDGWIGMGRPAGASAGAASALRQLSGGSSVNTGGTALPGSPARLRLRPGKAPRPQPRVATGRRDPNLRLGSSTPNRPRNARKAPAQPKFRGGGVGGSALDSDRRLGRGRPRREPKFRSGGLLGGNGFGGGSLGGGFGGSLGGVGPGPRGARMNGLLGGRSPAQPKFRSGHLGGGRRHGGLGGVGGLGSGGAGGRPKFHPGRADRGILARAVGLMRGRLRRRSSAGRPLTGHSSTFRIGSRGTGGLR